MTDQDPTQRYTPPPDASPPEAPPPQPASAPGAPPPAPSAPGDMPAFAPPAPAESAVATTPVTASSAGKRRSPLKWAVALVVVALVAGSAAAATLLLTGASGTSTVVAWTPANSVTYAEARLDLPGNQQAELAKVVSAFPGFDDQAAFPTKLNEILDQLVSKASDGTQSYTADIQPWFGGQLGVSVGPLPSGAADVESARFLALASVTDEAKATAWAASVLQESGATSTTETYNGTTITVVKPSGDVSVMATKVDIGYAVVGPVLAVGDVASIKAAIDTGGTSGLNTNEQFKTAAASLPGDHLAFAYTDTAAMADAVTSMTPSIEGMPVPALPSFLDDLQAPWNAVAVQADNGALVVESRQPHVDALGAPTNAASTLPSLVPADTVVLVDHQDLGGGLKRLKALLASDPSLADGVQQVDDALKLIGGFDTAVGWIGEAGIAITNDAGDVAGGLVVVPSNADDTKRLFTQLRGFIELAGGEAGVKITDQTYNGATISVVDLSGLGGLAGAAAGVDVPGELTLAYSVTDGVVVFGSSVDFVKAVIDAPSGSNLASTDRFRNALGRVDSTNTTLFWLDIAGVRTLAEPMLSGDDKSEYESSIKPYVEAFDSVIATSVAGDIDEGTLVLSVTGN